MFVVQHMFKSRGLKFACIVFVLSSSPSGPSRPRPFSGTSIPPQSSSVPVLPPSASQELVSLLVLIQFPGDSGGENKLFTSIGTGAGIGSVFGSLIIGYARNPSLKQQLFSYAILGFALSEAMGLFCLMMAFLLLFAF